MKTTEEQKESLLNFLKMRSKNSKLEISIDKISEATTFTVNGVIALQKLLVAERKLMIEGSAKPKNSEKLIYHLL